MLYPLTFRPIFKTRVWGGRRLAELFAKDLPPGVPVGESWEISDRPGDISVVANGPLAGWNLRRLMEQHGQDLLGFDPPPGSPFPLLVKLLDAREKLSLQVHPPAGRAGPGREPKTEMWFIAHADPGAELFVGLRRGITRAAFKQALQAGQVAQCFHRVPVKAGDAMFLPSGRVHAIGAGLVIFEIQQNSDTTYRVYDWGRVGLDGKPRELHLAESLASIDFDDYEPALSSLQTVPHQGWNTRLLVDDPLFTVEHWACPGPGQSILTGGQATILAGVAGASKIEYRGLTVELRPGEFCLVPASLNGVEIATPAGSGHLRILSGRT